MSSNVVIPVLRDPATLRVCVRDGDGNLLNGARVDIVSRTEHFDGTTALGVIDFGVVRDEVFEVVVEKDWYVPEPARRRDVAINQPLVQLDFTLDEVRFYLYVDADRDGLVDDDRTGVDDWQWGAGNKGAIILCNVDDDPPRGAGNFDANDIYVNTGGDALEIAPLDIRRQGGQAAPASWTLDLTLEGDNHQNVRIFDGVVAASRQVIGPGTAVHHVPNVQNVDRLNYGMEAIHFANRDWNGLATITLTVTKPVSTGGGEVSYASSAEVRVAPWMMPSQDDVANTVYMVDAGDNNAIRGEVQDIVVNDLNLRFVETAGNDRWMQDCMELGYAVLPRNPLPHRMECVMKAHRDAALEQFPITLLARNFGFYDPGDASPNDPTTYDSTGNLECTPPVRNADGDQFPWGRIYYGEGTALQPFNEYVQHFLHAQAVQRPIPLNTSWLEVGHVDEMMTFLPNPAGAAWKRWKLVVASPADAYRILDAAAADNRMLVGRSLNLDGQDYNVEMSVGDFLAGPTAIPNPLDRTAMVDAAALRTFNTGHVADGIEAILDALVDEISLDKGTDVIRIPVLFIPADPAWETALALTADMVNMLVLNDTCVVPQPFGPVREGVDLFRQEFVQTITAGLAGNVPHIVFLDDWDTYHDLAGEIHCGTNTLRKPANMDAWLATAAARWWEFAP